MEGKQIKSAMSSCLPPADSQMLYVGSGHRSKQSDFIFCFYASQSGNPSSFATTQRACSESIPNAEHLKAHPMLEVLLGEGERGRGEGIMAGVCAFGAANNSIKERRV